MRVSIVRVDFEWVAMLIALICWCVALGYILPGCRAFGFREVDIRIVGSDGGSNGEVEAGK